MARIRPAQTIFCINSVGAEGFDYRFDRRYSALPLLFEDQEVNLVPRLVSGVATKLYLYNV